MLSVQSERLSPVETTASSGSSAIVRRRRAATCGRRARRIWPVASVVEQNELRLSHEHSMVLLTLGKYRFFYVSRTRE